MGDICKGLSSYFASSRPFSSLNTGVFVFGSDSSGLEIYAASIYPPNGEEDFWGVVGPPNGLDWVIDFLLVA